MRRTPQQAFAQAVTDLVPGAYSVNYFDVATAFTPSVGGYGGPGSSGGTGDALLRIVNAGNFVGVTTLPAGAGDSLPGAAPGALCANIYVYNDVQEQQECCSCPLSANSLQTFSVINNLTSNPLNPKESLSAGVIKILCTEPADPANCSNTPGAVTAGVGLVSSLVAGGLHAWINHTETMASNQAGFSPPFGFITSTSVEKFAPAALDLGEGRNLLEGCAAINTADKFGSQAIGICSCGLGD
ncbi:MAG: hypothetical protein ACLQAT_24295 [Candidatus Binataceae bacterium]